MVKKTGFEYSTKDVINNVNRLLKQYEEEKINPAVFLHSLIFTTEYMIKKMNFIPKQIADIRRQSRKIIEEIDKDITKKR